MRHPDAAGPLDDGFTAQHGLFAAIHRAETAFVEPLAKDILSDGSPAKVVSICHSICHSPGS
jgi:hypothetical protein